MAAFGTKRFINAVSIMKLLPRVSAATAASCTNMRMARILISISVSFSWICGKLFSLRPFTSCSAAYATASSMAASAKPVLHAQTKMRPKPYCRFRMVFSLPSVWICQYGSSFTWLNVMAAGHSISCPTVLMGYVETPSAVIGTSHMLMPPSRWPKIGSRASTKVCGANCPQLTNVFTPSRNMPSGSVDICVRTACASVPALGSVNAWEKRTRPSVLRYSRVISSCESFRRVENTAKAFMSLENGSVAPARRVSSVSMVTRSKKV